MKKSNYGFTLVEIMVTIAILGILAAIAIPNYQNSVRKANRTDAKTALNTLSNELARFYAVNRTYTTDMTNFSLPVAVNGIASSENGHFRVGITAGASGIAKSYRISAVVKSSIQVKDTKCNAFILLSSGLKTAQSSTAVPTTDECW